MLLALLTAAAFFLTLHLALRKSRREWVPDYLYAGENFHTLRTPRRAPVTLAETGRAPYSFAIFGDAAGAESASAAHRNGAAAFRALVRTLTITKPAFAISLGDLARQATRGRVPARADVARADSRAARGDAGQPRPVCL